MFTYFIIQRFNHKYINYEKNLTSEWKNHWNFQLYKILKIQYSVSLNKFYSFVTEVPCEFIIKHRTLELSPPLEEIKKSIYKEVNKFLSIPNEICNFIEDEENEKSYYHTIVEENNSQILKLYEQLNISITNIEFDINQNVIYAINDIYNL